MEQANLFFNTIGLQGDELKQAQKSNANQDAVILELFKKVNAPLIPFDVWNVLVSAGFKYPITSVRRSITCLTEQGKLIKLSDMKKGMYGKNNHKWIYKAAA